METIKAAVAAACFVGIAISAADIIKPSEAFNKQVKFIFTLIFLISILTPFISGSVNLTLSAIDTEPFLYRRERFDARLDGEMKRLTEEKLAEAVGDKLKAEGLDWKIIKVNVNISDNSDISINYVRLVLADGTDTERVARIVSEFLSIDSDKIFIE